MKNNGEFGRNFEDISFDDLIEIFKNMKVRVIWSIVTLLLTCSSAILLIGMKIEASKTAIELGEYFDIFIKDDEIQKCIRISSNPGLKCNNLALLKNNIGEQEPEKRYFEIRVLDPQTSLTDTVGSVLTKKNSGKLLSNKNAILSSFIDISQPAIAQANQLSFNWHGRKHDFEFREKYVDKNTIRRYYSDGWVLEYKVDQDGHSILSTFKWIRRGRCFLRICI